MSAVRILFINPNSTQSMTDKVLEAALLVAPSEATVTAITSTHGPASIQGREDGVLASKALLPLFDELLTQDYDAFVIACFDDTALPELQARTAKPVVGIGQAGFHACMLLGMPFSVVTTLAVSVPVIEENIQRYGAAEFCRKVRASEVAVLELEEPGSDAEARISAEIGLALQQDAASAIVLGCAGMSDLADRLADQHQVRVIDGVRAATGFANALVHLGSLSANAACQ